MPSAFKSANYTFLRKIKPHQYLDAPTFSEFPADDDDGE
jgi:hypothetical protein